MIRSKFIRICLIVGASVALLIGGSLWLLTSLVINYSPNKPRLQPADFDRLAAQISAPIEKEGYQGNDGVALVAWYLPASLPVGAERWGVILTHGGGADKSYYLPLAQQLRQQGFDVLLPDLRGSGESAPSPRGLTLGITEGRDVAAAAAFLADQKHVSHIAALGVSMGGVATVVGAAADARIGPLILESSSYRPQPVFEQTLALLRVPQGPVRSVLARIVTSFGLWRMSASWWDVQHGLLPAWRLAPAIAAHPVLFIFGDKDPFVSEVDVHLYARRFAGPAQIFIFRKNGHGVYRSHPEEFSSILFKYLNDWRGAGPVYPPPHEDNAVYVQASP